MENIHSLFLCRQYPNENCWMRENNIYCDGHLCTNDGGIFNVHRLILSCSSPYFNALFRSKIFQNRIRDYFTIPGVTKKSLEQILSFVYGKSLVITSDDIPMLITAADYLIFPNIVEECVIFMKENLALENCVDFFNVLNDLEHLGLTDLFYRYLIARFNDIVQETNVITNLQFNTLEKLLSENLLVISNEKIVWSAILQWMEANEELLRDNKRDVLLKLLRCLRIYDLDETFIANTLMQYPLLKHFNRFSLFTDCVFSTESNVAFDSCALHVKEKTKRSRLPKEITILIQNDDEVTLENGDKGKHKRNITEGAVYIFEMLDWHYDYFRKVGYIQNYYVEKCLLLNQTICFFDSWQDVIITFDILSGSIAELPCLGRNLLDFSFCENYGCLYAFGYATFGFSRGIIQDSSFDVYNAVKDTWDELAANRALHYSVKLTSYENKIYAAGYNFFTNSPNEIIFSCYDIENNEWKPLPPPSLYRCSFRMTSFKGKIYIYGGYDRDNNHCLTIDRFDTKENKWSQMPDLPSSYSAHFIELEVIQGKLVVFSDDSFLNKSLQELPYFWDEDIQSWTVIGKMSPIFWILNKRSSQTKLLTITDKNIVEKLRYSSHNPFTRYSYKKRDGK